MLTELRVLLPGQDFKIHGLEEIYRDLQVVNITDSCVQVKGSINDGGWHPLSTGHTMSGRTEVYKI